jgi:hypothetical protein
LLGIFNTDRVVKDNGEKGKKESRVRTGRKTGEKMYKRIQERNSERKKKSKIQDGVSCSSCI